MLKSRTHLALLTAAILIFGSVACSDTAEKAPANNTSNNNNAADAGNDASEADTVENEEAEVPADWKYAAGYKLRFTNFALDASAPLSFLNKTIDKNIKNQAASYPIIVLMELKDIDSTSNTLALRGGAGIKADLECLPEIDGACDYKWDPDSNMEYTPGSSFDFETGEMNAAMATLDFIVTFEASGEVLKSVIPITDLTLQGNLTPTAHKDANGDVVVDVSMTDVALQGYITGEAAKQSHVQVIAGQEPALLYDLLGKEPKMNVDTDGDGTNDAWKLTGKFSAIETTIIE